MIATDLLPLANHLWQSTLCVGVVWLLALTLKKNRAAVRYWLWLASSVKFLIPFSLLVNIGSQFEWRTIPSVARAQWSGAIDHVNLPFAVAVPVSQIITLPESATIPLVLAGVWLCGFAVSVLFWCRCWLKTRATRCGATPLALDLSVPVMSSRLRVEPGVFGIWKPVILLPEGIAEHLTPAQLRLILAHEICHVRRRDNLTGAIHMLVEAVFWFYPLVWWIRARLIDERERACDETVCSQGCETESYAEGILKVCQFYLESPRVWTAGITGADLKRRIEAIMVGSIMDRMNFAKKTMLATAAIAAIFLPVVFGMSRPQFGLASIKRSKDPRYTGLVSHRDGYLTANGPLSILIEEAYRVKRSQIIGAPAWIDSDQYLITAKADRNLSEEQRERALQALLEDRFEMKIRREPKEVQIYALTMGGNAMKQPDANAVSCRQTPCPPAGQIHAAVYPGFAWLQGREVTMALLTNRLSSFVDRPILDETGYAGRLDVDLQFALDKGFRFPDGSTISSPHGESRPSVFVAVQEQLGLRIESARDRVNVLVVDDIARPSPD